MKYTKLSAEKAGEFYAVHSERPFYGELVEFMSSGPIVAAVLEKDNAVEDFRTLIGATNPAEAAPGTVRALYATSIGENAVHGFLFLTRTMYGYFGFNMKSRMNFWVLSYKS